MSDDSPTIPLADVLRAANELVSAGLIEDYALGGALAAIYYVEPFTTYDADIFFIAKDKTLERRNSCDLCRSAIERLASGTRALIGQRFSCPVSRRVRIDEEAVRNAKPIAFEGVTAKVFRPEYIIAVAASVGRHKDLARVEQLLQQAQINQASLDDLVRRYDIKLPKS